jgi:YfiH family protein
VPGCDGLYTTEEGLALAVLTADCVPLAVAFPSVPLAAVLHAGWRGTIGDIAGSFLARLREELGLSPPDARVVMGPAIGPCCYLVEEGRARLFVEKYGEESGVVREDGGFRVDLPRANRLNLARAGVREENVHLVGGCTACEASYFSFRRDGETGRQGAFILVERKASRSTGAPAR